MSVKRPSGIHAIPEALFSFHFHSCRFRTSTNLRRFPVNSSTTVLKQVSRRQFLKLSALTAVGTLVAISAHPAKVFAAASELSVNISRNHGHVFVATLSDLLAAGARDYDITGTSSHPHTLTITEEILATLQQTKAVDIDSSEDAGHAHTVRLTLT
ncbi:MAG: twin-arginine translocation signal domain-containing protein [Proteobacteria bacterium]|nr:MAG: twin-arginine translocation signal domain-containing protein [Pseudomonadota bacterium]